MALKAKAPFEAKIQKPKIIIFGGAGVGKTFFSMQFPSTYYIDAEGNASRKEYQRLLKKNSGVYMGIEDGANDFDAVIGEIKALATEKHEFRTLAIGSISKLYNTVIAKEAERLGDRDAYGASKRPAIAKMRQLTIWLQKIDMTVLLEAYEANKYQGKDIVDIVPDCWDRIDHELSLVIHLKQPNAERIGVVKKSHFSAFPKNSVIRPFEFSSIAGGLEGLEDNSMPFELITEEQLLILHELLNSCKINDLTRDSILNKAQATDWPDMSAEHAEKTIDWLKGKKE